MKLSLRNLCLSLSLLLLMPAALPAQEHRERDFEIALTRGQYEIELGNFAAAAGHLERALAMKPGSRDARLSLGIALARGGELGRAREVLQKAVDADPGDGRARYELALVLAKLGDRGMARDLMARAAELSRNEELRAAAEGFLRDEGRYGPPERPGLRITAGMQYDSNVILEQDAPPVPSMERKADWRGVIVAKGTLPFLRTDRRGGEASYQFYQSLHRRLEDYNVQQHAARLSGQADLSAAVRLGLAYSFEYSVVGTEHYSTAHRMEPRLTLGLSSRSLTELRGAYESRRFFNTPLFTNLAEKSGTNAAAGIVHTMKAGPRAAVSLAYTYDRVSADQSYWDYTGHRAAVNGLLEAGSYRVFLGAAYHDRRYGGTPPGAGDRRHDGSQELSAGVSRKIGSALILSLTDTYTFNDSNLATYEYRRNIVGLFAEMAL